MITEAKDHILRTLESLRQLEAAMARYYLSCSETWKDNSSFWMALAVEEERHEKVIVDLSRIVETHPDKFEEGIKVEPSAVESFIAAIDEETSDIIDKKSSVSHALSFAMNMEESVLEGRFFEMVRSQDEGFSRLVEVLADDLARHRQHIIEEQERVESLEKA